MKCYVCRNDFDYWAELNTLTWADLGQPSMGRAKPLLCDACKDNVLGQQRTEHCAFARVNEYGRCTQPCSRANGIVGIDCIGKMDDDLLTQFRRYQENWPAGT